jgi:hypothetical protein
MKEAVVNIEQWGDRRRSVGVCTQEGCGRLAFDGGQCAECKSQADWLDEWVAHREAYREKCERFFATFLFVLAGSGFANFALSLWLSWRLLFLEIGWALFIAAIAVLLYRRGGQ